MAFFLKVHMNLPNAFRIQLGANLSDRLHMLENCILWDTEASPMGKEIFTWMAEMEWMFTADLPI